MCRSCARPSRITLLALSMSTSNTCRIWLTNPTGTACSWPSIAPHARSLHIWRRRHWWSPDATSGDAHVARAKAETVRQEAEEPSGTKQLDAKLFTAGCSQSPSGFISLKFGDHFNFSGVTKLVKFGFDRVLAFNSSNVASLLIGDSVIL